MEIEVMDYEVMEFNGMDWHIPNHFKVGSLVTWNDYDTDDTLNGMVIGFEPYDFDDTWGDEGQTLGRFHVNVLTSSGTHKFEFAAVFENDIGYGYDFQEGNGMSSDGYIYPI